MNQYELMTLTKASLGEVKAKDLSAKIGETIASLDGKVLKNDFWGKRKLAYKLGTETDGIYEVLELEMPSSKVTDLKKKLNLENDLVRYLITAKS